MAAASLACTIAYWVHTVAAAALTGLVVWQTVVFVCVCMSCGAVVEYSASPTCLCPYALKVCKMLRGVDRWAMGPRGSRWMGVRGLGEPKQRVSNHDDHLLTRNLWSVC